MRKLRNLFLSLALMLGFSVGAAALVPTTASALSNCHAYVLPGVYPQRGYAYCESPAGASNQVRVVISCWNTDWSHMIYVYGQWKTGTYNNSWAYCTTSYWQVGVASYQVRLA